MKLLPESFHQITNSFYKTNNKIIITNNQENGNPKFPKDNSFIRSKEKKFICITQLTV